MTVAPLTLAELSAILVESLRKSIKFNDIEYKFEDYGIDCDKFTQAVHDKAVAALLARIAELEDQLEKEVVAKNLAWTRTDRLHDRVAQLETEHARDKVHREQTGEYLKPIPGLVRVDYDPQKGGAS